jgi:NAD(P)-dependent dehydrogenase (short-subunit alcohol dehydrogenase family)
MTPNSLITNSPSTSPVALITGGSKGLGFALTAALAERGWQVVLDGRDPVRLASALDALPSRRSVTAVPGDVGDPGHRDRLIEAVTAAGGGLDLLVHNASSLGAVPLPHLADYPLDVLADVFLVNAFAPLALTQLALPLLRRRHGMIISISSDAAVEAYPGWGGYGAAKAALDQLTAVLAVELPELTVNSFDPGDMRTELASLAFSGAEYLERPEPATVVPALLRLIDDVLPSGRYTVTDLRTADHQDEVPA